VVALVIAPGIAIETGSKALLDNPEEKVIILEEKVQADDTYFILDTENQSTEKVNDEVSLNSTDNHLTNQAKAFHSMKTTKHYNYIL